MNGDSPAEALARYLAQRREMGLPPLVLSRLTPREALDLAGGAMRAEEGAPPPAPAAQDPRPADPAAPRVDPSTLSGLPVLQEAVAGCTLCGLHQTRTRTVFADGNPHARVMVVGEAPGANEDRTGLPFVGAAGKLLDLLLASVGLSRADSVYICNVLKCRPPQNRDPAPDEIQRCSPYLHRQIELVAPEAILAVGAFAAKLLSGRDVGLSSLRGEVHSYRGVPMIVTYHPAALLRNGRWTRSTWDDLQLLREVLDGPSSAEAHG